jgi:hypothetical protein
MSLDFCAAVIAPLLLSGRGADSQAGVSGLLRALFLAAANYAYPRVGTRYTRLHSPRTSGDCQSQAQAAGLLAGSRSVAVIRRTTGMLFWFRAPVMLRLPSAYVFRLLAPLSRQDLAGENLASSASRDVNEANHTDWHSNRDMGQQWTRHSASRRPPLVRLLLLKAPPTPSSWCPPRSPGQSAECCVLSRVSIRMPRSVIGVDAPLQRLTHRLHASSLRVAGYRMRSPR